MNQDPDDIPCSTLIGSRIVYDDLNPQLKALTNFNNECPQIKNHSAIIYKRCIYLFGGYDGKKNHNTLHVYDIDTKEWSRPATSGDEPPGRNGHTASLVDNKMYIIGGWLGSGPFAASDMFILDLNELVWEQSSAESGSPGPCNMHSTDLIQRKLYLFRGGDGKDYLNDSHAYDVDLKIWGYLTTDGDVPPARANHSSAVINTDLYIFGGWDGSRRLNDLYSLDTLTLHWKEIKVKGHVPSPRAGMSLCNVESKLFLFGGSGPSASCFNDLQIFDPVHTTWGLANTSKFNDKLIKARAGHTMLVFEDKLYIMGGSYGQAYFKDFYIIDTDPAPEFINIQDNALSKLKDSLSELCNNPRHSDIQFIVEKKPFYAHKVILSMLSEKFKGMFSSGMKESSQKTMEIENISYPVFAAVCRFLYTGKVHFGAETEGQELSLDYLLEFLAVSDEFMIDEIKFECERHLANLLNEKNFDRIQNYSEMFNASQLRRYCDWYYRRNIEEIEKSKAGL